MESPKIKNLYFKIGDYKLRNGLAQENEDYFIGRRKIISRLKFILTDSKTEDGAYLITGYRGMGKTSTVERAVKEAKEIDSKIKSFNFSLSQDNVKELDLLRQIAWKLDKYIINNIDTRLEKGIKKQLISFACFVLSLVITLSITNLPPLLNNSIFKNPFPVGSSGSIFLFFGLFAFFFSLLLFTCNHILDRYLKKNEHQQKLKDVSLINNELKSRLLSSYEQRNNTHSSFNMGAGNPISHLTNFFLNKFQKNENEKTGTAFYEKANTKELEQYLATLLEYFHELRERYKDNTIPKFLFIIDELDKIEPDYPESAYPASTDTLQFSTNKKRSRIIINLLANLKNFLNTAHAKFIFIGGRDMYDAYLADIADRESFYSSIFKEVIYVPSFFKDKLSSNVGLTHIAEHYLCKLLIGKNNEDNQYTLNEYFDSLKSNIAFIDFSSQLDEDTKTRIKFKITHTLQNYILFLTYRCNGSPKKLIELIESNIICNDDNKLNDGLKIPNLNNSGEKYLKLGYQTQYEINLHSNIYRPYTIKNSQHHKSYSDKLLYTTAYLFDHLLKFHNNAFSWDNLERLPDLVLTNNDPNFRAFYSEILNFLTHQHLRKTTNAVFQYKFNSKIANEIRVCSKLSEQSSAGFNFALDESLHIKNHYYNRLSQIQNQDHKSQFQEIYLHSILGDLSFNDGDYDNAIIHYSKASLPLKKQYDDEYTYALEIKNSIVLGLCFEKNKMFNQSLSVYKAVKEICNHFPDYYDRKKQIFQRPFIAELGIFEKDRQSGVTYNNLTKNFIEYHNFLCQDKNCEMNFFPCGKEIFEIGEDPRKTTLIADYYFSVGNIMYFRNNRYKEFEETKIFSKNNKLNAASYYYSFALSTFINERVGKFCGAKTFGNILLNALQQVTEEVEHMEMGLNNEQFDFLGNILTKLGDSILSSINTNPDTDELNQIDKVLDVFYYNSINTNNKNSMNFEGTHENPELPIKISSVFKIYRLAYLCYKNAGKLYSAIYQYKKVLYILLDSINNDKTNFSFLTQKKKNKSSSILDQMTIICMNAQTEISEISNRRQITKYRKQFEKNTNIVFSNLSTSPDIKEYIYLCQTIKIKLGIKVNDIYIGEYSTISSMFTRVAELKYVGDKYRKEIKTLGNIKDIIIAKLKREESKEHKKNIKEHISLNEEIIQKIAYSFFAYSEILRIISIYGLNYILNHSFKAAICERLADICALIELLNENNLLINKLKIISGESYYKFVDDLEYIHLARYHYEAAKSLHNGGVQYSEFSKEMYFLNDDFNDNLTHFCAATERYRLNTGRINDKLNKLNTYLSQSKLTKLDNYI